MTAPENCRVAAVDFDGTLAITRFPQIIAPVPEMINYCKQLKRHGTVLILYTCRKGQDLQDAVDWCHSQGLTFDYINENTRENLAAYGNVDTRKICADIYIDDKAVNPKREKMWRTKEEVWMSLVRDLRKDHAVTAVRLAAMIVLLIEIPRALYKLRKRGNRRCKD